MPALQSVEPKRRRVNLPSAAEQGQPPPASAVSSPPRSLQSIRKYSEEKGVANRLWAGKSENSGDRSRCAGAAAVTSF